MLLLPGSSAVSAFKASRIMASLDIAAIYAFHLHLVQGEHSSELDLLLRYGSLESNALSQESQGLLDAVKTGQELPNGWILLFVFPRPGTISPWSSKATDIAKICGLSVQRIERGTVYFLKNDADLDKVKEAIHDRMTHMVFTQIPLESILFPSTSPRPLKTLDLINAASPLAVLQKANVDWGLALAQDEMEFLADAFIKTKRDPTDVELMMFAQVNSEHCRHKIFGATWTIDNKEYDTSLFAMIKNTFKLNPDHILSAYSDNAAVLTGPCCKRFGVDLESTESLNGIKIIKYTETQEEIHTVIKVETHNHPTAISPFPGASTGSGGEIRDEAAVGQGSKTKAGLVGFSVSNLEIPGFEQPWEVAKAGKPDHIASALDIMIDAPLGGAAFNNEFGRPGINGYFRTYLQQVPTIPDHSEWRGYTKPIMIAGGMGTVRPMHTHKKPIPAGSIIIVLGGPAMLIGLGGGAASSMAQGQSSAALDFASVQRDNPEMERRAQMVIDACTSLGSNNPIISIHDVGAGGISNALPELVHDCDMGAIFQLRDVPCADASLSPMEIWCNESQERYVLAVSKINFEFFSIIAVRERCPFAAVGVCTDEKRLVLKDSLLGTTPIDLPMSTLFGKAPKMHRVAETLLSVRYPFEFPKGETVASALDRVLSLPTVASKSFLITIADRTVTGLVARDQFVGPWQTPVSDTSIILSSYNDEDFTGQAMSMGERTPIALISPASSARMAVVESLTNLVASHIPDLTTVRLSANWMSAASHSGEGVGLYEAVKAVGLELCPALGLTIPVGKDSMSMKTKWQSDGCAIEVTAPLSLVITAFGQVVDARLTLTPQLRRADILGDTTLIFLDLASTLKRMGGSCIAQVYSQLGNDAPDVVDVDLIKSFWKLLQTGRSVSDSLILAYHDRSDGGLLTTIVEMCFAGRVGASIDLSSYIRSLDINDVVSGLFNEELGAVIQVQTSKLMRFKTLMSECKFPDSNVHIVGSVLTSNAQRIKVEAHGSVLFVGERHELQRTWSQTSFRMQSIRDNPLCSRQEFDSLLKVNDEGLHMSLTFDASENIIAPLLMIPVEKMPRIAILREQGDLYLNLGVNSNMEMAYAFHQAGFQTIDVHMTDLLAGLSLSSFAGLACPGGFSYGDVLGAGAGWAKSALLNKHATSELSAFFARKDTIAIGICNGCQMLAQLVDVSRMSGKSIIPGTDYWPTFQRNTSEQFEARMSLVKIEQTNCIFFDGMQGSILPIAVSHGEGRAEFKSELNYTHLQKSGQITMSFVNSDESIAEISDYPANPNGSVHGLAGVSSANGRVLALMPHPERVIRGLANTWGTVNHSGWKRIFFNARKFFN